MEVNKHYQRNNSIRNVIHEGLGSKPQTFSVQIRCFKLMSMNYKINRFHFVMGLF